MEQLKPPNSLCFEGNLAENWRAWIQKFDLYLIATGIAEKSEKVKCATFLHVAGDDAIKTAQDISIFLKSTSWRCLNVFPVDGDLRCSYHLRYL